MRKNIFQAFMNNLQIFPTSQILFLFLFASFEFHKLYLFLFVQKLARQHEFFYYFGILLKLFNTLLSTKGLRGPVDCCTILCGLHGPGQQQQSAMDTGREWSANLKHSELQLAEWGSQCQDNVSSTGINIILLSFIIPSFFYKKMTFLDQDFSYFC